MTNWAQSLFSMRAPIAVSITLWVVLVIPNQSRELYRALAQHWAMATVELQADYHQLLVEISMVVVGLTLVSWAIWFAARRASAISWQQHLASGAHDTLNVDVLKWAPRILVLGPSISTASGLLLSSVPSQFVGSVKDKMASVFALQYEQDGLSSVEAQALALTSVSELMTFNYYLWVFSAIAIGIGCLLFIIITVLDEWLRKFEKSKTTFHIRVAATFLLWVVIAAIVVAIVWFPVRLPQTVGAFFIICLFIALLQLVLIDLADWHSKTRVPIGLVLLAMVLVAAGLDLNDNHSIRTLPINHDKLRSTENVSSTFQRWMANRIDKNKFSDRPYPVYIVAAQGGGLYAANHVAGFLAELQDLCPGFAHHLFAISGVSGGSVGASVFAGLTKHVDWASVPTEQKVGCVEKPTEARALPFTDAMSDIFRRDLWSPLVAGLLFPDFLQQFIFFPIEVWDRARTLESALEAAYREGIRDSGFPNPLWKARGSSRDTGLSQSYLDFWDPTRETHTPALILNTTDVATGERRVIAPFQFSGPGLKRVELTRAQPTRKAPVAGLNLPLSTAAILSARFPWVTPAAHYYEPDASNNSLHKVRIVDGAYFENSGVATALDLVREIVLATRKLELNLNIELNILVFTSTEFSLTRFYSFAELLEPIRTMLNARSARAKIEIGKAVEAARNWSAEKGAEVQAKVIKLELRGYGYPLPLGWRLSPVTGHLIAFQSGLKMSCAGRKNVEEKVELAIDAGCAKRLVYDKIR